MRVFDFNAAIVRTPGRSVVNGLSATPGPLPTYELLLAEHQAYVAALRAVGVLVSVLEPLEQFPDSVFVEDPALVFSEAAILLRPGAPTRIGEAKALAPELQGRFRRVLELDEGYADGGDILVTPRRVLIGLSRRTDRAGAAALRKLLTSIGLEAETVEVPGGTLHLKSDCSLVDEETVIATENLAAARVLGDLRVLVVPPEERAATNAVRVNDTVFVRDGCPRTRQMLVDHGLDVVPLPVREIAKIDAGLSCMSLRWLDHRLAAPDPARPLPK
jgi:dimethylargininase